MLKGHMKRVEIATTILMVLIRSGNPWWLSCMLSTRLALKGSTAYFVTFPGALEVDGME